MEVCQKYPTQQMYIDAKLLKNTAEDVVSFINRAEDHLEVPIAIAENFLENVLCDSESGLQTNAELSPKKQPQWLWQDQLKNPSKL